MDELGLGIGSSVYSTTDHKFNSKPQTTRQVFVSVPTTERKAGCACEDCIRQDRRPRTLIIELPPRATMAVLKRLLETRTHITVDEQLVSPFLPSGDAALLPEELTMFDLSLRVRGGVEPISISLIVMLGISTAINIYNWVASADWWIKLWNSYRFVTRPIPGGVTVGHANAWFKIVQLTTEQARQTDGSSPFELDGQNYWVVGSEPVELTMTLRRAHTPNPTRVCVGIKGTTTPDQFMVYSSSTRGLLLFMDYIISVDSVSAQ